LADSAVGNSDRILRAYFSARAPTVMRFHHARAPSPIGGSGTTDSTWSIGLLTMRSGARSSSEAWRRWMLQIAGRKTQSVSH